MIFTYVFYGAAGLLPDPGHDFPLHRPEIGLVGRGRRRLGGLGHPDPRDLYARAAAER